MPDPTKITFFGVEAAPYPGAARKGCKPTDTAAVGWHIVVGGTQVSIDGIEDFAKHVGDFLRYAYEAGRADAKAEIREKVGL
jgi:hypothetical protein